MRGSLILFDGSPVPETLAFHPSGNEILSLTSLADVPVVLVNVRVTSCEEAGVNVVIRDRLRSGTSYLALAMFACTALMASSVG
jgi:hypothetical protein